MIKVEKIKGMIRSQMRRNFDKSNQQRLTNKDFTLFSSNCTGGVIYHSLNLKFLSPTINVYFEPDSFIKFLSNPKVYLNGGIKQVSTEEYTYPLIQIEDIIVHAVHYKTSEEFIEKWISRGKRINYDNIFVLMAERDGCTYEHIRTFDQLQYKNKVIFVHKPMPEIKSACYIPGIELDDTSLHRIQPLTSYIHRFTCKRYIDLFDYVEFFNTGKIQLKER